MGVKIPLHPGYVVDSDSGRQTKEMVALPGGPALGELAIPGSPDVTSDTVDLEQAVIIECLTAGTLTYITVNGDTRTRTLIAGDRIPVFVKRVKATGFSGTYTGYVYNLTNKTPTDP